MKKVIKVLLCLLVFILLIGCTSTNTTIDKENISNSKDSGIVIIKTHQLVTDYYYDIFYDKDTKVCYLITGRGGITPLYNADGSLKTYNEDEEQ